MGINQGLGWGACWRAGVSAALGLLPPQTERAQLEAGRFVYRMQRSPMCEYLVNFLHKLRQLPERYMMNSVLENFTILQVRGSPARPPLLGASLQKPLKTPAPTPSSLP